MRENILDKFTIDTMVHMGNGVMKIAFGTNATVFRNAHIPSYHGMFSYAGNDDTNDEGYPKEFPVKNGRLKPAAASDFKKVPGAPIAYWVSDKILEAFEINKTFCEIADARAGLQTSDNNRFLRLWHEVSVENINFNNKTRGESLNSTQKWFPCNKGGAYRKWFGNFEHIVNWKNDGEELFKFATELYGSPTRLNLKAECL